MRSTHRVQPPPDLVGVQDEAVVGETGEDAERELPCKLSPRRHAGDPPKQHSAELESARVLAAPVEAQRTVAAVAVETLHIVFSNGVYLGCSVRPAADEVGTGTVPAVPWMRVELSRHRAPP
jgi:hypothetical protein